MPQDHPSSHLMAQVPAPPLSDPTIPWVMFQLWEHLLFLHWPISLERLRPLVPGGLEIDTYEGQGWVTLVPMHVVDLRPRGLPAIPKTHIFPELNLRTYVRVRGRAGVFFLSIDAGTRLGVWLARHLFSMPYFEAEMAFTQQGEWCYLESHRPASARAPRAQFAAAYRPVGPGVPTQDGTLDHFLIDRTVAFLARPNGTLGRLHIRHSPWSVQVAEARIETNTTLQAATLDCPEPPQLLHYARGTQCYIWPMLSV